MLKLLVNCPGKEKPEDSFRIILICELLDQVEPFVAGWWKIKKFFVLFQNLIMSKPYLPIMVEYQVTDIFQKVVPSLKRFVTREEAKSAYQIVKNVKFLSIA